MAKEKRKARLNLYLNKESIQFAKEWSYVTNKPISRMLEEFLNRQKQIVSEITPFQWLNDPIINPSLPSEDQYFKDIEDFLANREELVFCQQNPEHPRAKIRRNLEKEYDQYLKGKMEIQKEQEKDLIKRWMEVFQPEK